MTKRLLLWLGCIVLLIATSLYAQNTTGSVPFEGSVTYLLEVKPKEASAADAPAMRMRMMMQVKGDKSKMNASMSMLGTSIVMEMLMLSGQRENYLIDHDARTAKRLPVDTAGAQAVRNAKVESFERVGTDTALGMSASVYQLIATVNGIKLKARMLMNEKFKFSSEFIGATGLPRLPNVPEVRGLPLLMNMDMDTPQGSVVMSLRCLEFKLHPVDDATLTLPIGYTVSPFTR